MFGEIGFFFPSVLASFLLMDEELAVFIMLIIVFVDERVLFGGQDLVQEATLLQNSGGA